MTGQGVVRESGKTPALALPQQPGVGPARALPHHRATLLPSLAQSLGVLILQRGCRPRIRKRSLLLPVSLGQQAVRLGLRASSQASVSCSQLHLVTWGWATAKAAHRLLPLLEPTDQPRRGSPAPSSCLCPTSWENRLKGSWFLCSLCFGGTWRIWQPSTLPTCANSHPSSWQHLTDGAALPPGPVIAGGAPSQAHGRHSREAGAQTPVATEQGT